MRGPVRLVACDLDGTLLRSDGTASARSVRAVDAVQRAGVTFVVATARPPRWTVDLVDVMGRHGLAVCSNGAFSYDVLRRTVVRERTMSRDTVLEVVARIRQAVPRVGFAVESRLGFGSEPGYLDLSTPPPGSPVGDVEDLIDPLPGKLLARTPALGDDEFLATVVDAVGDRGIVAFSGVGGLAEISAAGVTKASVLAEWCAEWGIDAADVCAFGDMPNDLPMLRWAGTSYAVANAHPEVLAAATCTCPGNDDDGVATVLERLAAQPRRPTSGRAERLEG